MLRISSILLFLITSSSNIYAGEVICLDRDLAKVQGLSPGENANEYILNNHLSEESVSGEDDGGFYKGKKYIFKDYEVTDVRGQIDSIRITSPHIIWAGRIKLGMERAKLENILSPYRVYKGDESSQYLVCSDMGDVYAILYFDRKHLTSIEISIERP